MANSSPLPRLCGLCHLTLLLGCVLLAIAQAAAAEPKDAPPPLNLDACRQVALERQPAIAAYRASVDVAALKAKGLADLRLAPLVAHDIPIRRQQGPLGVQIAQARVDQAVQETTYSVTRMYFTAVYAREQNEQLDKALENLKDLRETVRDIVKDGLRKDVTTRDVDRINVLYLAAQAKQEEAKAGILRAMAALREAMGVGPDYPLVLASKDLPTPKLDVTREQMIELALANRPEPMQASLATEVFSLEVQAQGKIHGPSGRTFSYGADLHADAVPTGSHNGDYRPGAVGEQADFMLVGSQSARIAQAQALATRSQAVAEKTRNLIRLDAEDVFFRWQEASNKLPKVREAADAAEKLARNLREDFKTAGAKVSLDDVIIAGIVATQMRIEANETLHRYAAVLASLERVTGGALKVDFGPGKAP